MSKKLCKNNLHYYDNGIRQCPECRADYNKKWYALNKIEVCAQAKLDYDTDPDKFLERKKESGKKNRKKISKKKRIYYFADPIRAKGGNLRKYWPGSSAEEAYNNFVELLEKQNNKCAICKLPEIMINPRTKELKNLAVDHCHKTGKVRGLLCVRCNHGIGNFKDNEIFLEEALKYLKG